MENLIRSKRKLMCIKFELHSHRKFDVHYFASNQKFMSQFDVKQIASH
jgi:hypothetical protein